MTKFKKIDMVSPSNQIEVLIFEEVTVRSRFSVVNKNSHLRNWIWRTI